MTWELRADARRIYRRQGTLFAALTALGLLLGIRDHPSFIIAGVSFAMFVVVLVRAPAMAVRVDNGSVVVTNMFGRTAVSLGDVEHLVVE